MGLLTLKVEKDNSIVKRCIQSPGMGICDFVCPKNDFQRNFPCDYIIWMDTISEGRFEDTNKMFEKPIEYDLRIKEWIDLNQLRNPWTVSTVA